MEFSINWRWITLLIVLFIACIFGFFKMLDAIWPTAPGGMIIFLSLVMPFVLALWAMVEMAKEEEAKS